ITGWGCCVRHHRMDMYTSGTSRNAKMPNTADTTARRSASVTSVRNSRYERYSTQSTNVEVSRASQVHQMPQTGLAQMGPVTRTTVKKATPTSAEDTASQSHFGARRNRQATLAITVMKKPTKPAR